MVAVHSHLQPSALTSARPAPGLLLKLHRFLPRGNLLDDEAWHRRHALLRWLVGINVPALFIFGLWRGYAPLTCVYVVIAIVACLLMSYLVHRRRLASFFVTAGLVYSASALVGMSGGSIEAHFYFFVIIPFIALYQDWVPFLWNIVFTVVGHGLGSAWSGTLIFNHVSAQQDPWLWSLIHGIAVLACCVGMVIYWRYSEDEQNKTISLRTSIADAEIERRRFTSDLLVNLARRNQSMLHLQLGILNQLEEQERDPDALSDLFRLDHLATRIRRNAESLLVLSGEDPPRVWSQPVPLRDVVRAAIAETEDLDRVIFEIDEEPAVLGHLVTGLTHLLAELVENAVRFSSPQTHVTLRGRPDPRSPGAQVITVEDWGLGMPPEDMAAANELLAEPPDVDLSTSQRFGLHVVSRLARRQGINVRLTQTADGGVTAVVVLPSSIFVSAEARAAMGTTPSGQALAVPATPSKQRDMLRAVPAPVPVLSGAVRPAGAGATPRGPAAPPVQSPPAVGGSGGGEFFFGGDVRDDGWRGWWDETSAAPATEVTSGIEDVEAVETDPPAPTPVHPTLAHRTPQAHLAPELRRPRNTDAAVPDPEAIGARDALSQYQASRLAALDTGDLLDRPNGRPPRGDGRAR